MKQTLTFHPSTVASRASRINVEAFDKSLDAFEKKEYLPSFHYLLDYINSELRNKYGNKQGTEFNIPHGSIVVNLTIEDEKLTITAPFLSLPDKGKIPLLRQIAELNINVMDLSVIHLKENRLFFRYSCPLSLVHPYKIYYVLDEICNTGDRYDDEFAAKFGAQRIYEPRITPYDTATIDQVYRIIQLSCRECLDAVKEFETGRKYGFAWNIIAATLLKILYFAQPQGQLLNDLNKAVREHDREDIPLPEVVARGKEVVQKLAQSSKEKIAEDLYFVEIFVSGKRRSNLKNIQENFESTFEKAAAALDAEDYMPCCLMIVYKFYEMYHYNDVQDDVNNVVVKALAATSAKPWEEAAPVLLRAMEKIMEDELEEEDQENAEDDLSLNELGLNPLQQAAMQQAQAFQQAAMQQAQAMQAQMQQAMQGINMEEYMKNVQNMMSAMMGGANAQAGNNSENQENTKDQQK